MALSRRTGQRFQASIWPGFVDAMTGLLLVLMFVLTIFMVVQFVLRETISGQATELNELSAEVAALAEALGLERQKTVTLENQVVGLQATLTDARGLAERQSTLIAALTDARDQTAAALETARTQITAFEAQVAALLSQRDDALGQITKLEGERDQLLTEQEALNLALVQARTEIDAQAEAARLAAAEREALDALIADLQNQAAQDADANAALAAQVDDLQAKLSEEEIARLAEAAAAEALRERLENSQAEITAMTLALEQQRQEAEDTLTLLAAAQAAREELNRQISEAEASSADLQRQLAEALISIEQREGKEQSTLAELSAALLALEAANASKTDQEGQLASLEAQLAAALQEAEANAAATADLQTALDASEAALASVDSDQSGLRDQLQLALAARLAAQTAQNESLARTEDLELQLAAALAAKAQSELDAANALSEAEERARLLALANQTLEDTRSEATEAEKQTAALNQQVAALRQQLGVLQALLDDSKDRDAAAQVQLSSLGSDLNAALARAAAEERRRRELEEAERLRLQAEAEDLEKYRSEFFGRMSQLLAGRDGVRIVGDRFVFSSEVLFPSGGADLSFAGRQQIADIALLLRDLAGEIPSEINWVLQVDGHTDNVPIINGAVFSDNWELSQARALSVVRFMSDQLGFPPQRLSANGFGEHQPLDPANTGAARAKNRRIELKFTEK